MDYVDEFLPWYTYWRLTGFADEQQRLGFGLLAAMMANFLGGTRKQIEDFFPDPFRKPFTWEESKAFMAMMPYTKEGRWEEHERSEH